MFAGSASLCCAVLTSLCFSGAELGNVSVKLPFLSTLMETGACGVNGACAAGLVVPEPDSDSGNATTPRKSSCPDDALTCRILGNAAARVAIKDQALDGQLNTEHCGREELLFLCDHKCQGS